LYKMNQILSDSSKFKPFKQDGRVEKDSFIYAEDRFNRSIRDIFKKHKLSNEILPTLLSSGSTPARLYGLPKIHKNASDPPYRPVLSMVNSYPSNLAKYLDSILKPFIPNERTCQDSFDFKEKLINLSLPPNFHTVSYDVISLFTNIPVKETIKHIIKIIPAKELPFPKTVLSFLLNIACTNILFSFNGKLYTQIEGMCMGSNLGPTMASFAMDMIERHFDKTPIFYQRYVDDIYAIFHTKEEATRFLDHINSFHTSLKFTIEHSIENKITFLDIDVSYINNKIETCWHMKKTNTGVYLPKTAYSPLHYRMAAIRSLVYRAYKLCSTRKNFDLSYNKIRSIFINNGYHFKFIDKIKNRTLSKINTPTIETEQVEKFFYYKVPFIKEIEKKNKITFKKINTLLEDKAKIVLAYNTNKTASFFPNKDKLKSDVRSQLVYQFTCGHCGGCYTGETKRHFSTRRGEHLDGRPKPSEVTDHVHPPTPKSFRIILQTTHTKIGEAIIYKEVPVEKRINAHTPGYQLKLF